MIAAETFEITPIEKSRVQDVNLVNIPFGKTFTDHMLEVDYKNGVWQTPRIRPYQSINIAPSLAALHYGQAIFEGIKAYKDADGKAYIFRPHDNFKRFNFSARRMAMPEVPEDIFMDGMHKLIDMDSAWIPQSPDHSLYIRPFMFSSEEMIGVKTSEQYKFMIILSPTGPYYNKPMRIYVEEHYVRAVAGGVGEAKTAGNYAASMLATQIAKDSGYDQVLWMDALEHKYIQECGTMNVFFIIDNKVITPGLEKGGILAGITRDSVIALFKEMGYVVEERQLSIDEVIDAHKHGKLQEVFGSGTAATISVIKELKYKDYVMEFDVDKYTVCQQVKSRLDDIRYGRTSDEFGWMYRI
jgi:branched-chain amino acid aminotransferase